MPKLFVSFTDSGAIERITVEHRGGDGHAIIYDHVAVAADGTRTVLPPPTELAAVVAWAAGRLQDARQVAVARVLHEHAGMTPEQATAHAAELGRRRR